MGNLPASRVTPSPPFYNAGVDYAGPFKIQTHKGRGGKVSKAYLCLFICFAIKALELVTDLSMETFLLAFRTFVARRGKPAQVFSDNGKKHGSRVSKATADDGITWHFNPAYSPHFGGFWEAGVKSVKRHKKLEATLNSRPLARLSCDPNDLQPLTPAHFLIGRLLTSLPDPDVTHISGSRLSRYQRVQWFHQRIWKRWSKEYVSEMQQRTKWRSHYSDLEQGTLVLLKEDRQPPLHWKLGRVVELPPGSDGYAMVASVLTQHGVVRRSFVKLCPLPVQSCSTAP
ncbi:hypothetical protein HUJ05_001804 [Dendroctonus ponderosae]|nr:hypothetical protein HUJ05_001804 [Dendroctonus ponderosae]